MALILERPPRQKILFLDMKTGFKDAETPRLPQFYTNESNGTKFNACFFFYRDGSRGLFRQELTGPKWLFYRILTFSPKLHAYFKVNIMPPNGLGIVHIYTY